MALAGFVPKVTGGRSAGVLVVGGRDPRRTPSEEMARLVGLVFEDYEAQLTQVLALDEVMLPMLAAEALVVEPDALVLDEPASRHHDGGAADAGCGRRRRPPSPHAPLGVADITFALAGLLALAAASTARFGLWPG